MDKTLHGKYLDAVDNIGVNMTSCVVYKVLISTSYTFQDTLFTTLHVEVKGEIMTIEN